MIEFTDAKKRMLRCNKCGWKWKPNVEVPSCCPNPHCRTDFRDAEHNHYGVTESDEYGNFSDEVE